MLSKKIYVPAVMKRNDQARVGNDMEETKEEPVLIGHTPELSYSLHFTSAPSLNHPDAGFDILGISRATLVTAFLNELTNCHNKKIDSEARNAISQFKCGFIDEIRAALEKDRGQVSKLHLEIGDLSPICISFILLEKFSIP